MLNKKELDNFYQMLRAEGARENIELALQIAAANGIVIGAEIYDQLIEISRDISKSDLMDIFDLKEKGELIDKIEFVNAARGLNFYQSAQLSLTSYFQHFNEILKIQCWSLGLIEVPRGILHFEHLEKLNIGNNKIESLPEYIIELKNLKEINLFANRLTQFPTELLKMPKLLDLQLGANQIEDLPESIGKLKNLEYLGLTDNKIAKIPEALYSLKSLKVLSLTGNPIQKTEVDAIKTALADCRVYV